MENLWISCGGPANPSCHWSPGTWAITHPLKMVPCATLESHLTLSIFFNLNHTLLSANGNYFIRYVEKGRSRPGKSLTCCYFSIHNPPISFACYLIQYYSRYSSPASHPALSQKKTMLDNNTCPTPIHIFLQLFFQWHITLGKPGSGTFLYMNHKFYSHSFQLTVVFICVFRYPCRITAA